MRQDVRSDGPAGPATHLPPLAVTAARLRALDDYAGFDVGVEADAGWVDLARAEPDGHLDTWLAALVSQHGRKNVAGSMLSGALARAVVGPTVSALILDGHCSDPVIDNLAVRTDADGYLDRCAVRRPTLAVLPDNPAAADRHSRVMADESALSRWWAERTAGTLAPLLAAVRERAPYGVRALWGTVSDEITGTALWIGQLAGRDPYVAWSYAQRLLDALAPHAPVRLTRASPLPVIYRGGEELFQVRGTCCLYYRSTAAADDGPVGDRFCNTCPLRDADSRQHRLRDILTTTSDLDAVTS